MSRIPRKKREEREATGIQFAKHRRETSFRKEKRKEMERKGMETITNNTSEERGLEEIKI